MNKTEGSGIFFVVARGLFLMLALLLALSLVGKSGISNFGSVVATTVICVIVSLYIGVGSSKRLQFKGEIVGICLGSGLLMLLLLLSMSLLEGLPETGSILRLAIATILPSVMGAKIGEGLRPRRRR